MSQPNSNNPVLPTLQHILDAQSQLNKLMTQNFEVNKDIPAPPPSQVDMLIRFLKLRPEKFSRTTEPILADDWLRSVNKDLVTIGCTDAEKVRFAAHLLEGPAADWWDSYQITCPIEEMTWELFQEGFRAAHISSGVMKLKREEFFELRQDDRNVIEYMNEFNNLARYAPDDVDTDTKKKQRFLNGLNDELSILLTVAYTPDYQSLVDQAIVLESKLKQVANKKRKHKLEKHHPESQQEWHTSHDKPVHFEFNHHEDNNHHCHNIHGHDFHGENDHHINHGHHSPVHTEEVYDLGDEHLIGENSSQNLHSKPIRKDLSQVECFKCKKMGHYS